MKRFLISGVIVVGVGYLIYRSTNYGKAVYHEIKREKDWLRSFNKIPPKSVSALHEQYVMEKTKEA